MAKFAQQFSFLSSAAWGQFHILFCALPQTFEKLFRGVECALRCTPSFNWAISMICAVGLTSMKSTLVQIWSLKGLSYTMNIWFAFWFWSGLDGVWCGNCLYLFLCISRSAVGVIVMCEKYKIWDRSPYFICFISLAGRWE